MQVGGNAKAHTFFQQHDVTTEDLKQKYNSRAAILYRDKLASIASTALKEWEGHLHIDASGHQHPPDLNSPPSPDFWKQVEDKHPLSQSSKASSFNFDKEEEVIKPAEMGSSSLSVAMKDVSISKKVPTNAKKPVSKRHL